MCAFVVFGAASAPDYVVGKYKSLRKWLTARMGTANTVDNASLQVPLVSPKSLELSDAYGLTGASTTAELNSGRQTV